METRTRPAQRRALLTAGGALVLAALTLAGCSSSTETAAMSSARESLAASPDQSPLASTDAATEAPQSPVGVDVDLPLEWVTDAMRRDGDGYALTLTPTSRTGVYDGHFFHQAADGAVSGQKFLTLTVTGRDSLSVTWPDGAVEPGTLALVDDGSPQTEVTLDPGCLAYLEPGRSQLDCRLYPKGEPIPVEEESPTAAEVPSADEAMGFLCSVGVDELERVTDRSSDAYSTSVLQIALTALGYDPGQVDGSYGKKTRAAVVVYQEDAGLTADGLVGPKTWSSLQADACRIPDDPAQ